MVGIVFSGIVSGMVTLSMLGGIPVADSTPVTSRSAITSMWAWGNSVDPADDDRGLGQPEMAPAKIAAFATAHHLDTVFLSVPWAANQGAIATWLSDAVRLLHADGISVSALGGDPSWTSDPALVGQWVADARDAAPFDSVQLDLEPWVGQPDAKIYTPQLVAALRSARSAAGSLPIGMDLPWWLEKTMVSGSPVFDTLTKRLDSVAIIAFADHAARSDGIVALARPAVAAAVSADVPFTIGVETDTPAVAGGAEFTFFDEGRSVLESETAKVRRAFSGHRGYRGVTVEHLRAWIALGE